MSEYTPTTEEVRFRYSRNVGTTKAVSVAEFDRWLAEHDRELSERVWDEGSADGVWNFEHKSLIERTLREPIENPYRQGEEQ